MKISLVQDQTQVSIVYSGSFDEYEQSSTSHGFRPIYVSDGGEYENLEVFHGSEPWLAKAHFLACQSTKVELIFCKQYVASVSQKKLMIWDSFENPPRGYELHDAGWTFFFNSQVVVVDCFSLYFIDPKTVEVRIEHYSDIITDVREVNGELIVDTMS